ncbi:MAG: hypothetical protein Q9M36_05360 [Sulfurovum sp.]|nr:hypothetical protein [Sulfurovum sp.]
MRSHSYFISQEATVELLARVSHLCAECYNDMAEGDIIHYDREHYRYVCKSCEEVLYTRRQEHEAKSEEEGAILF